MPKKSELHKHEIPIPWACIFLLGKKMTISNGFPAKGRSSSGRPEDAFFRSLFRGPGKVRTNPPPIFRKDPQEDLYAFPTKGFLGAAGRREVLSLIRFQF